ncbi:heavy metal-associated domain-containing protein [Thermoflavifilum sp.]|uniref:cation transporter n=1 Tax=Thermoflavifilum sp. TaxID=1968839 RepID=UPI0025DC610B|nr:heavy metal-associated domain-containing protein [Thermoflavifilum sp.]
MAQSEIQDQTAQLDITGMTCTHCAVTIQRLLLRQPGVKAARSRLCHRQGYGSI